MEELFICPGVINGICDGLISNGQGRTCVHGQAHTKLIPCDEACSKYEVEKCRIENHKINWEV